MSAVLPCGQGAALLQGTDRVATCVCRAVSHGARERGREADLDGDELLRQGGARGSVGGFAVADRALARHLVVVAHRADPPEHVVDHGHVFRHGTAPATAHTARDVNSQPGEQGESVGVGHVGVCGSGDGEIRVHTHLFSHSATGCGYGAIIIENCRLEISSAPSSRGSRW